MIQSNYLGGNSTLKKNWFFIYNTLYAEEILYLELLDTYIVPAIQLVSKDFKMASFNKI